MSTVTIRTEDEHDQVQEHEVPWRLPEDMKLVAGDWSGKGLHVTYDGREVIEQGGTKALIQLINHLKARTDGPFTLVVEAPFEAFNIDQRQLVMDAARAAGITFKTISPRQTAWWRIDRGVVKSDKNDARAIYAIAATQGLDVLHDPAPALPEDDPWALTRKAAERELMVLRRTGNKELLWQELIKVLPKFRTLTAEQQLALGGSGGYSKAILPAAYVAARHTADIREWERLMGLYASGKPSQFRSDVFHHGWKGNKASSRKARMEAIYGDRALSVFRRNLRWLYRQVRVLDVEPPLAA